MLCFQQDDTAGVIPAITLILLRWSCPFHGADPNTHDIPSMALKSTALQTQPFDALLHL